MEQIRTIIISSMSALAAYLSPIHGVLFSILYMFLANFIFGLISGITVNDESFSFKKAFSCMKEVAVFYVIVMSVFVIGERMGNKDAALQCISMITYSFIYFYVANILKNSRLLFPNSKIIAFLYYLASVEFIKRIPYLKQFQELPTTQSDNR